MPTDRQEHKNFIDWSHKVLEELVALNGRYEALAKEIDNKYTLLHDGFQERYEHIDRQLDKMNNLLTGNGTPEKGLLIRVDRIEQSDVEDLAIRVDRLEVSEGRRTWLLRATFVASLGAILTTAFAVARGHFGIGN